MIAPLTSPQSQATETTEYATAQVMQMLNYNHGSKVSELFLAGKIIRTRKGFYSKESVDAFVKDKEERKGIKKAEWIVRGEAP